MLPSPEFRKQLEGYGLTTAEILYRMPDHPALLQSYIWQDYDLFPEFPVLKKFLDFWGAHARRPAVQGHHRP
ncbi:usg protein [Phenylobacterium sp. J367]|uniref:usg protein n=1 Tax=Phenylobacterium sp. J367 TaxID=2898435 RepID=UPI0021517105